MDVAPPVLVRAETPVTVDAVTLFTELMRASREASPDTTRALQAEVFASSAALAIASSADVTDAVPPPALMRLLRASKILWSPWVDTSPTLRAENADKAALTLVTRPSTDVAAALAREA